MATYYLKSGSGTAGTGTFRGVWTAATTYAAGDRVVTTRSATAARQFKVYECTTGGASHGTTEPTWDSTTGNTTTDNAVTWTCRAATTWANAHMFLDMLLQGDAAGDTVYVSHQHNETSAVALGINPESSSGAYSRIICVNDGAEPPTAVATSGVVSTTGDSKYDFRATHYNYGLRYNCGSGAVSPVINLGVTAGSKQVFENCVFDLQATGTSARIWIANATNAVTVLKNCDVKFAATAQAMASATGYVFWNGGSILSGSAAITVLMQTLYGRADIKGVDLSNAASTLSFLSAQAHSAWLVLSDCKLPASWSGSLISGTVLSSQRVEMYNCDSGDTNYRIQVQDAHGLLTQETTLVRTGGASDGTTALAWKIVTTTNAKFDYPFCTPEIVQWVGSTGSKTVTVEILRDSATNLTDAEVWLEVMYLGTSGYPLGSWTSDCAADILATPADQADSSETWTTTGMSNPNTQKLNVTVTVNEIGFIHARVCVAKASTTLYVDPKLTIT